MTVEELAWFAGIGRNGVTLARLGRLRKPEIASGRDSS
jgi:hypothetical protein